MSLNHYMENITSLICKQQIVNIEEAFNQFFHFKNQDKITRMNVSKQISWKKCAVLKSINAFKIVYVYAICTTRPYIAKAQLFNFNPKK